MQRKKCASALLDLGRDTVLCVDTFVLLCCLYHFPILTLNFKLYRGNPLVSRSQACWIAHERNL